MHHLVRDGGHLVVRNAGEHPIWDVIVLEPAVLAPTDFTSIGPGEVRAIEIPERKMPEVNEDIVTLQVRDNHGRTWRWTPLEQRLDPIPPRITHLARFVQWTGRRWPQSWHRHFARLPKLGQRVLWGYDPEGRDI